MVSLKDYAGREQAYVKHVFLERYLTRLVHKVASTYDHIVYIDGFAGPWQNSNERFEDTSFGIALAVMRKAKESWRPRRDVGMSAFLVESDIAAYRQLAEVPKRYPDINVTTYHGRFLGFLPQIISKIDRRAFTFFFVDPKGWKIDLRKLAPALKERNSEVVFNFMFEFINRAVNINDPGIAASLDELIPVGDWRPALAELERSGRSNPDLRKQILVDGFRTSLRELGSYSYVAETTVLRPLKDRPLYCLCYATRHPMGIQVFREAQLKALQEESAARATAKLKHTQAATGQSEIFESLYDMGPDKLGAYLEEQRAGAETRLMELVPPAPGHISYRELVALVMEHYVVDRSALNKFAARMFREGRLLFPGWPAGGRVKTPKDEYRVQAPPRAET